MAIIGYAFLLLFLPVSLLLYWWVLRKPGHKLWLLCLISYLFYALGGLRFLPLLLGMSLATFWLAQRQRIKPGIALNLLALGLFKYWDFGAANLNTLSTFLRLPELVPLLRLALPLGISFYVFKHIGYLLDVHQKRYPPTRDFLAFATFSAFFPQISAGPISNFQDTGKQLRALPEQPDSDQTYQGLIHISVGLAKKLLIADVLSQALQSGLYSSPEGGDGLIWAWFAVVMFALQLYFDFSGYTDLVLGVGHLFGITLPPNFNNPYLASNPGQFWQRWHISLSTWFRLYLFSPLSRSLLRRWGRQRKEMAQYVANLVTMLLVGLWHGAGWGFILWGGYHGLLLNVHAWADRRKIRSGSSFMAHVLLIVAVLAGWALFLSPDLAFARNLMLNLSGLEGTGSFSNLLTLYDPYTLITVLIATLVTLSGVGEAVNLPRIRQPAYAFMFGVITVLCLLRVGDVMEFIYIQF